jgi:hypothetical protein
MTESLQIADEKVARQSVDDYLAGRLDAVIAAIDDPSNTRSILIHGSWVRGMMDQTSDLDLVIIQNNGVVVDSSRTVRGLSVDTCCGTLEGLRQRLLGKHAFNNNFLLNALCGSHVYLDRGQCALVLIKEAERLRELGPSRAAPEERAETRKALHRMFMAAFRLSLRSHNSQEAALLATMRRDQVVVQAIYLYHCMRTLWTDGLPQMLRHAKQHDLRLFGLWQIYVTADSETGRLHAAAAVVAAAYDDDPKQLISDAGL